MDNIWSFVSLFFWSFAFIAYLFVLVLVLVDLFSDHELSGGWKAVWIIFLIFIPFVTALVYVIARHDGMANRSAARAYARNRVVPEPDGPAPVSANPTADIAQAQALLDQGVITPGEFDALKAKALGSKY